jgi:hypothetical protein
MEDSALLRIRQANAKLQLFLGRVGEALAGRQNFTAEDVRAIAEPVSEMAPVVCHAEHLRAVVPQLRDELEIYAQNLSEMDQAFDRLRCVLLARSAQIETQRGHLETVRLWADAWRQTQ